MLGGHLDERVTAAEADLGDNGGAAAEQRLEIERRRAGLDAVARPQLGERSRLGPGDAALAPHVAAHGAAGGAGLGRGAGLRRRVGHAETE